ncbi:MAG: glycoside hydrolase family 127 protein [Promethearchaeota archaeon]
MTHNSIQPLSLNQVKIIDKFWAPRINTNAEITLPHVFQKCEKTGRIANFSRAAGLVNDGKKPIFPFDDSDVFKAIEGAAYSLLIHPDLKFEEYIDNIIDKIAAAQEKDGYLYTVRTISPNNPHVWAGKKRWELVSIMSHELYNMGHLIEAGIAYYQARGKRKLLDVAIKCADLIYKEFGKGKLERIPGHQEIELALIRLYKITNNKNYLTLAKFFLDIRGTTEKFDFEEYSNRNKIFFEDTRSSEYNQSHKKVIEQDEAIGHAVRAVYMYSAMTDIISLYNDREYKKAIDSIWNNIVSKKLYITGGIGSQSEGESFGINYELPNLEAYTETCAAIGNIFWNHRLFLVYGKGKYLDVLERILFNGFLSGISLDGKKFFYSNPLASNGKSRKSWWKCPCCPTNIVRFIPQLPSYIYGLKDNTLFVNLYIGSKAKFQLNGSEIIISQETNYPWEGNVTLKVNIPQGKKFTIALRIPSWACNQPVPSDLYYYLNSSESEIIFKINKKIIDFSIENGFVRIHRTWEDNDTIELSITMPIKQVLSHKKVEENIGMVALEHGPIVYCVESIDNDIDSIFDIILDNSIELNSEFRTDLLNGINIITGSYKIGKDDKKDHSYSKKVKEFISIPYYAWANRGRSEMSVWIKHN